MRSREKISAQPITRLGRSTIDSIKLCVTKSHRCHRIGNLEIALQM